MPNSAAGIDFKEAAAQAAAKLAETEAREGAVTPSSQPETPLRIEQPAVETNEKTGLFKSFPNEGDQPSNVESLVVDVDGESKSIAELRQGYMRQADYTKKTQEIAKERAELGKARTLWEALQENPLDTARKLYQRVSSGEQLTVEPTTTTKVEVNDIEALIEAKVQERLENDPRLQAIQADNALAEVNSIFNQIEADYNVELTDEDKKLVIQRALDEDTMNLPAIFALMIHEKDKQDREFANAERVATSSGRRTDMFDAEPTVPERFDTFKDAWKLTLAEEGADGLHSLFE